jgi:putative SOS response-associated peptidase YedK
MALGCEAKEGEVSIDVYGFLTTEPNAIVAPIHPKAMPVILATAEEYEMATRTVGRSEGAAA